MPKSRSRYARAQARARYRKPKRRGGSFGWNVGIAVVAILGVALLAVTVINRRDEAVAAPRAGNPATGEAGDHWHASLDVYVCNQWLSIPAPEFHSKAENPDVNVGIHSHGDGLIHIHPFNSSESGKNATLGRFLEYGGWSVSSDSFDLWDGADGAPVREKNGDNCRLADGSEQKGTLTWYVDGKKRSGNPADYQPKNGDQVALVFAPAGTKLADLGTPPNSQRAPTDEAPFSTAPTVPSTVPETPAPNAPPSS
jgi:hypothetical protein